MAEVRRTDHRLCITLVTAGLVVLGGVAVASSPAPDVVVTGIVDGDTIDVRVAGDDQRVHLLNVDTPEPGECVHDKATAFLELRLPPGSTVTLEYDVEEHDRFGRVLAGVVEDGTLVNEEIARNGLGVATLVEPNGRFHDDVLNAQRAAEVERLGLFSADIACTVPAQVREYRGLVERLEDRAGHGTLDGWAATASAAARVSSVLAEVLAGDDSAFPLLAHAGPTSTLQREVESYDLRLADVEVALTAERRAAEEHVAKSE
ncbi:thermonuclease family protein [Georgenia sp. H159]|uniref:thermonuclease family protein n=1 Tax=Georgenia sp. H159 TaxID=3076115 RepID=UPI002D767537|nr:thermonuclease family protein [Georgenia sp. H159]